MSSISNRSCADLLDIDESIGEERAAALIMTARAPWFAEDSQETEQDEQAEAEQEEREAGDG